MELRTRDFLEEPILLHKVHFLLNVFRLCFMEDFLVFHLVEVSQIARAQCDYRGLSFFAVDEGELTKLCTFFQLCDLSVEQNLRKIKDLTKLTQTLEQFFVQISTILLDFQIFIQVLVGSVFGALDCERRCFHRLATIITIIPRIILITLTKFVVFAFLVILLNRFELHNYL